MLISSRTASEIEYELSSLQYLGDFIRAAKEISKIDDEALKDYITKINELLIPLSKIEEEFEENKKVSELIPDALKAVIQADAPASGITFIFCFLHS